MQCSIFETWSAAPGVRLVSFVFSNVPEVLNSFNRIDLISWRSMPSINGGFQKNQVHSLLSAYVARNIKTSCEDFQGATAVVLSVGRGVSGQGATSMGFCRIPRTGDAEHARDHFHSQGRMSFPIFGRTGLDGNR